MEAERINEREKESLLHELNEGRQRERDRIQERLELEQEIRKRLNFKQSNEIALEYREKIRAKLKNEDENWKRKIMEEAEKAAKLDQMGNQKRRMKMQELRRFVFTLAICSPNCVQIWKGIETGKRFFAG